MYSKSNFLVISATANSVMKQNQSSAISVNRIIGPIPESSTIRFNVAWICSVKDSLKGSFIFIMIWIVY